METKFQLEEYQERVDYLEAEIIQLKEQNAKLLENVSIAFSKLKSLPRFTFLSPSEGGVRRFADKSGNWIEQYEVVKIYDNLDEALAVKDK